MRMLCAISLVLALVPRLCGQSQQPAKAVDAKVETIIFIRHAEKPEAGLGQINARARVWEQSPATNDLPASICVHLFALFASIRVHSRLVFCLPGSVRF